MKISSAPCESIALTSLTLRRSAISVFLIKAFFRPNVTITVPAHFSSDFSADLKVISSWVIINFLSKYPFCFLHSYKIQTL